MDYTKIEVSRDDVRAEVFRYLRENRERIMFLEPQIPTTGGGNAVVASIWVQNFGRLGALVSEFITEVETRLQSAGAIRTFPVESSFSDSRAHTALVTYYSSLVKYLIAEEICHLVNSGILARIRFNATESKADRYMVELGGDRLLLTEYGAKVVTDPLAIPYLSSEFFGRLRQVQEPDEELAGYLSEGLACLQNHLGRAAAMLLRLAAEHVLAQLIDSTLNLLQDKSDEQNRLKSAIRNASINIEDRAEALFKKLEHSMKLIPYRTPDPIQNSLRPAFHAIRRLGGEAAHPSSPISLEKVRDHYTLFVSAVYTISMEIVNHQQQGSGSTTPQPH